MQVFQLLEQFYVWVCCEAKPIYPDAYSFEFGHQTNLESNSLLFQSNEIKTTKYNAVNFFPKAMLLQYKRMANLYFLVVAILSTIPGVTPLSPALIWMPLVFVLVVSIVKEAYQDYHRRKIDTQINTESTTSVFRYNQLIEVAWGEVKVGDICLIKENQAFPADMILISSCQDDGVTYIETASLDGQKTSKIRYAFSDLTSTYKTVQDIGKLEGAFDGEVPTQSLDMFRGNLTVNQQRYAILDNKQLLYRGAKLRNTKQIWCVAAYTGQCSKIMLNSQLVTSKISGVEKRLNIMLVCFFICQLAICTVMSIKAIQEDHRLIPIANYLSWSGLQPTNLKQFIRYFMMFFIDYSSLIPISLMVSTQIVKLAQSYFIDFDKLMYSDAKERGVLAKTTTLNEELGQIQYVFTDKTGTLTSNKMTFHTAVIADAVYEFQHTPDEATYTSQKYDDRRNSQEVKNLVHPIELISEDTKQRIILKTEEQVNHHYFMALLVCNSVNAVTRDQQIVYESESPDEIALIKFVKSLGYVFLKREFNFIQAEVGGKLMMIKILQKFSFTSDRKRMSVLVEINKQRFLYTKGADNIIAERIKPSMFNIDGRIMELSRKGLRTLMVAMKSISDEEYQEFKKAINDSDLSNRDQISDHFSSRYETNLSLIGATALLDELQLGVPQTLSDFQRAGIKVWMLTGDKLQTAIEVSKSCNLIDKSYHIIECKPGNRPIADYLEEWTHLLEVNPTRKCSLVIEGARLGEIIANQNYSRKFAFLSQKFVTVICCRLLPIQKAHTVKLIKEHLKQICLAIGDGGNDVSMIKEAHIGIGLYGQEGMSAVQASDYAIPQFRMIWRLMFVHGRWNYIRISEMILYFTYKSILFTVPKIVFALYNGFSGQPIFDDYYIALYNVLFTSVPLLVRALFQQDVNYVIPKKSEDQVQVQISNVLAASQMKYLPKGFKIDPLLRKKFPKIYFVSKNHEIFNLFNILIWILEAVGLAIIITVMILDIIGTLPINSHGYNSDLWMSSIEIYTTVIILNTIKIAMHVRHWTKLFLASIIGCSLGPYFIYIWISNYALEKYVAGTVIMCFKNVVSYFVFVLLCSISIVIISLIIYISFHNNKVMKKFRLRMLEIKVESESISQQSKLDQLEIRNIHVTENIKQSGMAFSIGYINEKIEIKNSSQSS